jgi:DNA-binding SARP family transcriptional activator
MELDRCVRVLGPIDVMRPDGTHPVGGRRQRALLAALAVAAGRSVPLDQLREVVWGDGAPRTSANTLQSHVSHLRDLIGSDAIVHVDHAYRLDLGQISVDAIEFTRLLRRATSSGSPEERWQLSRDALALWRGQAFGDLADDEPFALEAYRLDELRLAAMEINLAADLDLGNHELVVGELECAVHEHPYHERLWQLLVEALLRSERRIDARRACTDWRRILSEADLEPSEELERCERRLTARTSDGG